MWRTSSEESDSIGVWDMALGGAGDRWLDRSGCPARTGFGCAGIGSCRGLINQAAMSLTNKCSRILNALAADTQPISDCRLGDCHRPSAFKVTEIHCRCDLLIDTSEIRRLESNIPYWKLCGLRACRFLGTSERLVIRLSSGRIPTDGPGPVNPDPCMRLSLLFTNLSTSSPDTHVAGAY